MNEPENARLMQLLRATAQGDEAAFAKLYDRTSPRLLGVANTLMGDAALAEDVLQDAFVQIWHRAGDYHTERGSVMTWLTTIVRYRAIDLLRKRQRKGPADGSQPVDPANLDYLQSGSDEDTTAPKRGPLASAIASETDSRLRTCIERLSGEQQRSVALAYFRGLTHQELALYLAEPLGTIKSRLRRALMRLKECLESLGQDNLDEGNEIRRGTS